MQVRLLYWTPRLLALAAAVFLSLFALDSFTGESGGWAAVAMHLIPSVMVLAALAVAWRHEVAGGLLFIGLGAAYVVMVGGHRLDWIAVVAGPLWVIGVLFLAGYARRAETVPAGRS